MRTSLGISAGNEVVCSALVGTAPNGSQNFDYRVVTADMAHSDLGDLVVSSIELMTTQMPRDFLYPVPTHSGIPMARTDAVTAPGAIAVAYRDREQAVAIRAAIGRQRRDVQLIPESTAALAYLRHTGLLDRYDTVGVIDVGASGMSVTVADLADDTVLRCERSETVSGSAIDELIYHHLLDCHFARRGTRPNRGMLVNRSRAAKEHLSIAPAVTIDHVAGQPLKLTRADFDELIADLLREAAAFVSAVFTRAPKYPQAVAVIGGGANIPAVIAAFDQLLEVRVHTVPEPEAAIAKGAALIADSAQPSPFPAIGLGSEGSPSTFTKLVGTLAGAVVVVGLVVGYGVKELVPTANHDVSPAGTTDTAQVGTSPAPTPTPGGPATTPARQGGTDGTTPPSANNQPPTTGPARSQTPVGPPLRPDPDLPQIPLPDLPRLLGPLIGTTAQNPGATVPRSNSGSSGSNPIRPTD
ncbi:Hsp70 family protein [Nocardia sp. CDC159]|uniref:Hsp70 family protein n=1 Tax=Nocardia pulmonis TaxID=2951408 RepID=A0A9X2E9D5_9NOCA|nr:MULTISPECIES: Hsp70 family protein [Nocardia]MCM6776179.1 Hsp70 family protein [Nocardia pulmonis]MCM6788495.1 Hsp70 family protein [Nocardia sp. CDC159]